MANNWTIHRKIDLSKPSRDMAFDAGYLYRNDNQAHVWEIEVTRDGAAVSLSGYGARGYFIRPDGSTIAVAGSISGNTARVTLNNSCYAQRGVLKGALRLEKTNEVITISAMVARVDLASTENIVINTETEPDVTALLAELDAAIEAAQEAASELSTAIEDKAVIYTGTQSLTDAQKATARGNIDAASVAALEAQATATSEAMAGKVAVQQGSGNAGKALVVGVYGAVALGEAGVPERVKVALLDIAQHVAYIDDQGQRYYDALYAALYGGEPVDYFYRLTGRAIAGESDIIVEHLDLLGSDISYSIVVDAQESGFDFTGSTEYSPEKGYCVFALGSSAEISLLALADQTRERVQYRLNIFGNYLRAWMNEKPANSNRHVRMAMSHEAGSGKVKARLIVDGVEATLGTLIENNWAYNYAVTSDVVRIGHIYNTELEMIARLFQGTVNDFAICNYAMTDDQIAAYMDAE